MATAEIQESCTSVRPNSLRMGTPRTPNISQTANMRVKAMVESQRTRKRSGFSLSSSLGSVTMVHLASLRTQITICQGRRA
jgi:hypothetical protein